MDHKDYTDAEGLHPAAYVQATDPGAVGAYKLWVDSSGSPPHVLYLRNAGNDGWDQVISASGGLASTVDAYASRPGAGNAGALFMPTELPVIERDNGATWDRFGPAWLLTPPLVGDFAWVNQDAATAVQDKGALLMSDSASTSAFHLLVRSAPSPPYTITVAYQSLFEGTTDLAVGVGWRQSSDGKLVMIRGANVSTDLGVFVVSKWNSPTSFNAHYSANLDARGFLHGTPLVWMRLTDDGSTNRIAEWSADGLTWDTLSTHGRTDFLTADQVGFGIQRASGPAVLFRVWHWVAT